MAVSPDWGGQLPGIYTDNDGNYSFRLVPGRYRVLILSGGSPGSLTAPHYYYLFGSSSLTLTQNTVMDIPIPAKRVGLHVQDPAGNPVAGVRVNTSGPNIPDLPLGTLLASGSTVYYDSDPAVTDAAGDATMWLFATAPDGDQYSRYAITAVAPPGSPFASFNVQNVAVTSDKSIFVVLQFLHDPPVTSALVSPSPDAGGNYPDASTVTLSAGAFAGFGVSATFYSLDGGPTQTYAVPFAVSGSGAHTVKYWSVDNGGVYEVAKTLSLRISATPAPNPPPSVTINGPATGAVYAVNTPVNFTGAFTDNAGDTHTALWKFDAITQPGTVDEAGGTVNASYTFTAPGVYAVSLTVTDGGGGIGTANQVGGLDALIVVYDPEGGSVTGGGWINSPAGAYPANPSLAGKANFGFVSKYQKGASVPVGETEFQLKVGNLNFHSTSYNWLVVSGARAQYKGSGTINGGGDYGFTLTAVDGQVNGGGGADKLRLKIYDKASGTVIYDNQMGSADGSSPSTVLGGGSVVIHN
jgi:hypothetical protein